MLLGVKKGQITIFVILGLVLLISASLVFFMQQTFVSQKLDAQARTTITEFSESAPLQNYVETCLSSVLQDGLELIGDQGGALYTDQGGGVYRNPAGVHEGVHYLEYTYIQMQRGKDGDIIPRPITRNVTYAVRPTISCRDNFIPPRKVNFSNEFTSYYPVKKTYF